MCNVVNELCICVDPMDLWSVIWTYGCVPSIWMLTYVLWSVRSVIYVLSVILWSIYWTWTSRKFCWKFLLKIMWSLWFCDQYVGKILLKILWSLKIMWSLKILVLINILDMNFQEMGTRTFFFSNASWTIYWMTMIHKMKNMLN